MYCSLINSITYLNGCAPNCCKMKHQILVLDILAYHSYFDQLPKNAKRKWLLDYFTTHTSAEISFYVCGKKVCQDIRIATLGISTLFFYYIRKKALSGSVCVDTGPHRSPLLRTNEAIAWLQNYIELVGDRLPR